MPFTLYFCAIVLFSAAPRLYKIFRFKCTHAYQQSTYASQNSTRLPILSHFDSNPIYIYSLFQFLAILEMSRYIDRRNNNFKPVEPIYFSFKGQNEVKISQIQDFLADCGHIQTFETIQNDAKLFYGKVIFLSDKVFFLTFSGQLIRLENFRY